MRSQTHPSAHFINREVSWLAFNRRVLEEAFNPDVPLLERIKFLAIVASNHDEFFQVRVARHKRMIHEGDHPDGPDALTSSQVMDRIVTLSQALVRDSYVCFDEDIVPALRQNLLEFVPPEEYTDRDTDHLQEYFRAQLLPILTPMAIDPGHPFPLLASGAIYLLFQVRPREETDEPAPVQPRFFRQTNTILVQAPTGHPRFLPLPPSRGVLRLATVENVISLFAEELLIGYEKEASVPFRVTRDADIEVDEDARDLILAIEQELRSRRWGKPVRLEIPRSAPAGMVRLLREKLELEERDVYPISSLIDLKSLFHLPDPPGGSTLRHKPWPPRLMPGWTPGRDLFALIREKDRFLHFPYQSFEPVVELVEQAAVDPDVLAIKITLYRVAGDSPIVQALIRAAEDGKQVTALVELRARFDEETNIAWARKLNAAGAHVIYGVVGYKTHAKACLIVRREPTGLQRYVHLSTGNYNNRTARLYTDVALLTAHPDFGSDISAFFNVITGYSLPPRFKRISMAPMELRGHLLAMIRREKERSTPEKPGLIRAKLNSLTDPEMIDALYDAGGAGVRIRLQVRGLCRLRCGVPGLSEHIEVRSVVDRFLEHSRIIHFFNGGQEEVYLSSADWMERNLDQRLELLFPVLDRDAFREVLEILDSAWEDNRNAWVLQADNQYRRLAPAPGEPVRRSQEALYHHACVLETRKAEKKAQIMRVRTAPPRR